MQNIVDKLTTFGICLICLHLIKIICISLFLEFNAFMIIFGLISLRIWNPI